MFCFSFHSAPGAVFLAVDGWGRGRLIAESVGAGIKDYYHRIRPGIGPERRSVTISLHSVLLSSLTSSSESRTHY